MEQKGQTIERESFWGNVRKLVQINLIQQRNLGIGAIVSLLIFMLVMTVAIIGAYYFSKDVKYYEVTNGYSVYIWLGILCILMPACQMFSNEAISMYPGNAVTRYLGRMIADHIRMMIFTLSIGLVYIMHCGLLWIFLQGKTGIDVSVIFDVRYLGIGLLRTCLTCMALYGIFSLFFNQDARFGKRFSISLFIVIVGFMCYCIRAYPKLIVSLLEWGRLGDPKLFPYIGICVLTWLVCISATVILACDIPYWRIRRNTEWGIVLGVIILSCGISIQLSDTVDFKDEKKEIAAQYKYGPEDLYSSILVNLPEDDYSMNENMIVINDASGKKCDTLYRYINDNDNLGFDISSLSDAAELEIPEGVDLSGVDDDHGVLIYQLHNVRVNGQEIYRDLVEDMQNHLRQVDDRNQLKLEYSGPLKYKLCIDFFPSADRFLHHGSRDLTMREYFYRTPYLNTILIISDARYEELVSE